MDDKIGYDTSDGKKIVRCYDCNIPLVGSGFWNAFINKYATAQICNNCSEIRDKNFSGEKAE
jgi:hypothetical protein